MLEHHLKYLFGIRAQVNLRCRSQLFFLIWASCSVLHLVNFSMAVASSNNPSVTPRSKCFRYKTPLYDNIRRTVSVGCAPLCNHSRARCLSTCMVAGTV